MNGSVIKLFDLAVSFPQAGLEPTASGLLSSKGIVMSELLQSCLDAEPLGNGLYTPETLFQPRALTSRHADVTKPQVVSQAEAFHLERDCYQKLKFLG
jgi:hypothetical protein